MIRAPTEFKNREITMNMATLLKDSWLILIKAPIELKNREITMNMATLKILVLIRNCPKTDN